MRQSKRFRMYVPKFQIFGRERSWDILNVVENLHCTISLIVISEIFSEKTHKLLSRYSLLQELEFNRCWCIETALNVNLLLNRIGFTVRMRQMSSCLTLSVNPRWQRYSSTSMSWVVGAHNPSWQSMSVFTSCSPSLIRTLKKQLRFMKDWICHG